MTRLTARGASLEAAFAALAMAVFRLIVDPARVEEREIREVRAHGPTPEILLERWIDECLYVHEVEGFAPARVEFIVWSADGAGGGAEPLRLHAMLHGEPLEADQQGQGPAAIARDPAEPTAIRRSGGDYEVSVGLA